MPRIKHSLFILVALLAGMGIFAQARAQQARQGVVVEMQPIENRGGDETARVKTQRRRGESLGGTASSVGGLLGMQKIAEKTDNTNTAVAVGRGGAIASEYVGKAAGNAAAKIGGPGETTRYMVKVRLDNRRVPTLTQLRTELAGIKVGSRVTVEGRGNQARLRAAN
ncbi:hypothetical protein EBB59_08655 [Lysobacter pythonis]|uniref:Glycine zipper 2TM domain-containing protein n=1 Tax=Solilutibacter pythonis TaxID=2483112 RepID=A0A3M2HPR0_9GAMM|nr:hypothetical protein [Lysobacter pythonis]RMH91008.1 hypothetical protein EBB59_08655 [Lysobacter pythonis]